MKIYKFKNPNKNKNKINNKKSIANNNQECLQIKM